MNFPRFTLAGILIALIWAIPAQAQFRIDDTGQTFTALQAALDAVTTGQTISIQAGTYTESNLAMYYKDCITIKARSGSQDVTLSGGSTSGAFSAYVCPELKFENIRFRNSDARPTLSSPPRFGRGGGLLLFQCKNTVITGCDFSNNSAETGGGIHAEDSDVDLFNCTVTGNTATGDGGGMYFDGTPVFVADELTLNNNTSGGNGGGMWCGNTTYFCMRDGGFIQNNSAPAGSGGAMFCSDTSTIEIADAQLMWGNTAATGPQGLIEGPDGKVYFQEGGFYVQAGWNGGDHYPEELDAGHIPITRITYPGYPTPASVLIIPDRSGPCLSNAYSFGGMPIDATIKVFGLTYPQTKDNIWLSFIGSPPPQMFFWPNQPFLYPDNDVDPYGRAQFQMPIAGGGYSGPPNKTYVSSLVDDWIHNVDLDIYFNSPDITGDGIVDLSDYILFTQAGSYEYRCDFNYDGVINLADVMIFAQHFCAFFAFPETPVPCSPCE